MEFPRQGDPRISVVVPNLNEGHNLRRTVENLLDTLPESGEVIVVDDGSRDGSADFLKPARGRTRLVESRELGVSGARNFGARHAHGELLVFSDAHVETPRGWWEPLAEALSDPSAGAAGTALVDISEPDCKGWGLQLTGPDIGLEWLDVDDRAEGEIYPVPLLTGAFWAMRRDTFERTGGFDEGMIRWGSEDIEYSLRLWLLGYELRMAPEVEVAHLFRERGEYSVDWPWILHNRLRLAYLHFSEARFLRVMAALRASRGFAGGVEILRASEAERVKAELAPRKVRNDDCYFQTFPPAW